MDYDYFQLLLTFVLFVLLILAIFWEIEDIKRIQDRPNIKSIKDESKRKKELEFYACFNSDNNIQWRGIFIMTFVATFLITYLIYQFYPDKYIDINLILLIFGSIILVFYIGSVFRNFHVYREMCNKVTCNKKIL